MALPTASDNAFPSLLITEGTAPSSPAAGKRRLYVLSADHLAYLKDSSGAVVNLITNPMTTAGDTIYGGASGVPTRLAGGTSGYVLTSNGTTSAPSWQAGGGGGSSAVLGAKTYSTGSDTAWASSSSGTTADIDATNAAITVTIPASGAIVALVELDFSYGTANNGGFIVLRTGSTDLQAAACISGNIASGGIGAVTSSAGHMVGMFYATGLTPGSLTLKVGFRRLGTTVLNVYANDGSGAAGHLAGPFVMTVLAA